MDTTNHSKPRRPWWRRILKILVLSVMGVLAGAFLLEATLRMLDQRRLPMPGTLVDIGTHRMHIWCEGSGSPTVVLDAGAVAFSTSWRQLMPMVAQQTRVCSFDRSGLGWSEAGGGPWDAVQASGELHQLLLAAGEQAPVIYAGHSLGAMLARVYAQRYPGHVAGLLLLEPADPEIIIAEMNAEREQALNRELPDPNCGKRCPIAVIAAAMGLPRWLLASNDILRDPLLPRLAVDEFIARSVRTDNIRHLVIMGRYFPRIFFQTGDNDFLGDIPVLFGYGSRSGELLGDHDSEAELREDQAKQIEAWKRTGALSSRFLGMREVAGANHLSLVTYEEHARAVNDMLTELIELVRSMPRNEAPVP